MQTEFNFFIYRGIKFVKVLKIDLSKHPLSSVFIAGFFVILFIFVFVAIPGVHSVEVEMLTDRQCDLRTDEVRERIGGVLNPSPPMLCVSGICDKGLHIWLDERAENSYISRYKNPGDGWIDYTLGPNGERYNSPKVCMYGNCGDVPRHETYEENMHAVRQSYPVFFDKYPELWPEDIGNDPLGCESRPIAKIELSSI